MRFDILTIFPELVEVFSHESILAKAQQKKLLSIHTHNLRNWTYDAHHTIDDKPFGGGLGMVFKVDPIYEAIKELKQANSCVILFSPRGRRFTQAVAFNLLRYDQLLFICGRYEGVDERVKKHIADETLSLGSFDLMGGDIPAMAVIETVSRLIPGVIGKEEFLQKRVEKTPRNKVFIEYPQYTRPEVFKPKQGIAWKVPSVLMSGNHKDIEKWRSARKKIIGK